MPELDGDTHPAGDQAQEIGQPRVIALVRWPELDEQHGALIAQLVPSCLDALHPLFRRIQPPSVRKTPWCLDRQAESIGHSLPPAAEHRRPRPAVEAAVKLSRSESGRITG